MKKILISNDDGIMAKGIIRLSLVAKKFGEVYVVAPDSERSAMSHSLTLRRNLKVWEVDFPVEGVKAYACDGKPADCVRLGVLNIVPGKPDVVLSGINYGFNVAGDIQYSATAGAAFEGAFQGIHSIAFSEDSKNIHEVTDKYIEYILRELLDKPLGVNEIWNVNFPACHIDECQGILEDRIVSTDNFYEDTYHEKRIDDKTVEYELEGNRILKGTEGTDLDAVLNNYVSIGKVKNVG